MAKEEELGYSVQDLHSVQPVKPWFFCPHCKERHWAEKSLFKTYPTRLWVAETECLKCKRDVRWLIDPDVPVEMQTTMMHRPLQV